MDPAPYILSLLIFYTTFRQFEVFAKTFREKLTKKVFVFAKGHKSVFAPTLIRSLWGLYATNAHMKRCNKKPAFRNVLYKEEGGGVISLYHTPLT
jgi:hypothetical protein